MLDKIRAVKERIERFRFQSQAHQIRSIQPIQYTPDPNVAILTMVGHDTLNMYLIAVASFMRQFGYGTIEVLDDGTLDDDDIAVLTRIIPLVRITKACDIETHGCPTYSSWKRLFRVLQLVENAYVIQLDSDIVAMKPLTEIHEKVKHNHGFAAGSAAWPEPVDVHFLDGIVKQWNNNHVQSCAERIFKHLDYFKGGTRYLRGCAGFCGYPKGSFNLDQICALSNEIASHIGAEKWASWGSEQTATLCLLSKSEKPSILPWPHYQNFLFPTSNEPTDAMKLIHFIGSNRFKRNDYRKLAQQVINNQPMCPEAQRSAPLLNRISNALP
ncbi:hypothetical protein ACFFLZ_22085 [Photobacterium aphoticum]|nr:hypothetical protein [Photobacterium aphoticum]